MAQVILTKNLFVGYRIKKSPNSHTPVYVPDEFLDSLAKEDVIITHDGPSPIEDIQEPEQTNGYVLRDFDEVRRDNDTSIDRLEEVSVSIITSNAAQLLKNANIDPAYVVGTGKDGRVTQKDVLEYIENKG